MVNNQKREKRILGKVYTLDVEVHRYIENLERDLRLAKRNEAERWEELSQFARLCEGKRAKNFERVFILGFLYINRKISRKYIKEHYPRAFAAAKAVYINARGIYR